MSTSQDRTPETYREVAAVISFQNGNWEDHFPLVEFTCNSIYQTTIGMAPFEALYGRKCRTSFCWDEIGQRKL